MYLHVYTCAQPFVLSLLRKSFSIAVLLQNIWIFGSTLPSLVVLPLFVDWGPPLLCDSLKSTDVTVLWKECGGTRHDTIVNLDLNIDQF